MFLERVCHATKVLHARGVGDMSGRPPALSNCWSLRCPKRWMNLVQGMVGQTALLLRDQNLGGGVGGKRWLSARVV